MIEIIKSIMSQYQFKTGTIDYEAMAKQILRQWMQEKYPGIISDDFFKAWKQAQNELQS